MLGRQQTGEVLAGYLDPDAFVHLTLARILLDRRAERFSNLRSDLERRQRHAAKRWSAEARLCAGTMLLSALTGGNLRVVFRVNTNPKKKSRLNRNAAARSETPYIQ